MLYYNFCRYSNVIALLIYFIILSTLFNCICSDVSNQLDSEDGLDHSVFNPKFEKFLHSNLHSDDMSCTDIMDFLAYKRNYNFTNDLIHETLFKVIQGPYMFTTQFSCSHIFENKDESTGTWPPPRLYELQLNNPEYLKQLTLNGKITNIKEYYMAEKQHLGTGYVWKKDEIDQLKAKPSTCGSEDKANCELAFSKYEYLINGSYGMVIGSQHFWAEAAALRFGATHVTTIEYQHITTDHPQLTTLTPSEATKKYLNHSMNLVDFIISYSSLEHDGLGRYGEPLNAFGDLLSVAKVTCYLRKHGVLFFAVPVGFDQIQFNAHRVYGYNRLSILFSLGFRIIDVIYEKPFKIHEEREDSILVQPIWILQKRH